MCFEFYRSQIFFAQVQWNDAIVVPVKSASHDRAAHGD